MIINSNYPNFTNVERLDLIRIFIFIFIFIFIRSRSRSRMQQRPSSISNRITNRNDAIELVRQKMAAPHTHLIMLLENGRAGNVVDFNLDFKP
jgi:hypothetical protein